MGNAFVIVPKALEVTVKFGCPRLTILKTFVASPRACSLKRSPILKSRKIARSTLRNIGPFNILRPTFPFLPAALATNAQVLNQAAAVWICDAATQVEFAATAPARFGSPARFGR